MMSIESLMPTLEKLSVSDRLELIERLRDSLLEPHERIQLHDWQIELLKTRLAEAEANPGEGIPLEEFIAELRKKP